MTSKHIRPAVFVALLTTLFSLTALISSSIWSHNASQDQNDPAAVASEYIRLMNREEFEQVKLISTPESHALLDLFIAFSSLTDDVLDDLTGHGSPTGATAQENSDEIAFTILKTVTDGEVAYVSYIEHDYAAEEETVMLKRVNGEWLIHLAKEDVFEEDFDALPYDTDYFSADEEWSDWDYDEEGRLANLFGDASNGFVNAWNAGDYATASSYTNQEMTRFLFERAAGQHTEYPGRLEIGEAMFDSMSGPFDFICSAPGSHDYWVLRLVLSGNGDEVRVISFERATEDRD